jgi:hypothetical protein
MNSSVNRLTVFVVVVVVVVVVEGNGSIGGKDETTVGLAGFVDFAGPFVVQDSEGERKRC